MIGRLVTAAVGIPALALVVWVGDPVFTVVVAVVAALGAVEVCEMARSRGETPSRAAAVTLSVALVLSSIVLSYSPSTPEFVPLLTASIGIGILALIFLFAPIQRLRTRWLGLTLGASVYPGALLAHAPLLRGIEQGLEWVVFLLVVTFSTDTGAFFVGKAVGKRPLAPTVSPGKTWEGAIGGFLAAVLAALAAAWALEIDVSVPVIVVHWERLWELLDRRAISSSRSSSGLRASKSLAGCCRDTGGSSTGSIPSSSIWRCYTIL